MKFSRRIVTGVPRSGLRPRVAGLGPLVWVLSLAAACESASGSPTQSGTTGSPMGGTDPNVMGGGAGAGSGTASGAATGASSDVGAAPSEDFTLPDDFVFGGAMDVGISVGEASGMPNPGGVGGASPVAGEEEDVEPIVACDTARATGDAPLIDDFEDTDDALLAQDGRAGDWYWYNSDDSDAQLLEYPAVDDAPGAGVMALHTTGSGYSWAGIGFGLHWGEEAPDGMWRQCFYDASMYVGVRFWGRGNDVSANFNASMPEVIPLGDGGLCDTVEGACWNAHGMDVTFGETWQVYTILFADMVRPSGADIGPLDASRIRSMQFDIPENAEFDIWIDDLTFITEAQIDDLPVEEPEMEDPPVEDPADGGAP